jgi:hypothetical protein
MVDNVVWSGSRHWVHVSLTAISGLVSVGRRSGLLGALLSSLCLLCGRGQATGFTGQFTMRGALRFYSPKGGSDPRSEETSEAGLWRLSRPQTGVAPALGSSPQAVIFRLRLLT